MSLRINTNIAAMNALRNLGLTSDSLSRTVERLSSGLRVNRASDDPAGLIISENLRAYIAGIQQAVNNAQDAANLVKTAEAALEELHNALRGIRQLVIHAGNTGVNDKTALQADQNQIRSLIDTINRIAEQTSFGSKKLLDGTAGIAAQVVDPSKLAGVFIGGIFGGEATGTGYVAVSILQSATRASYSGSITYASVTAVIGKTGSIVINGQTINVASGDTVQSLIDKINAIANLTGVGAQFNFAGGSGVIQLTQRNYGSQYKIVFHDGAGLIANAGTGADVAGVDAVANVEARTNAGTSIAVLFTGGRSTGDTGLRLSDTYGNVLLLTEAGNTASGTNNLALITAGNLQFQVGPSAGNWVRFSLFDVHANRLGTTAVDGKSVADIDVTLEGSTDEALKIVDDAISQISRLRGDLGSFHRNILETNMRALNIVRENLAASESTIRDANFAEEITNLTKQQILMQSGLAVLAQANSLPQLVSSLLR